MLNELVLHDVSIVKTVQKVKNIKLTKSKIDHDHKQNPYKTHIYKQSNENQKTIKKSSH